MKPESIQYPGSGVQNAGFISVPFLSATWDIATKFRIQRQRSATGSLRMRVLAGIISDR